MTGELNSQVMADIGAGVPVLVADEPAMVVVCEVSLPSVTTSGSATPPHTVPALDQLNSALKICSKDGHTVTTQWGDGGSYVRISHAAISGNALVIPDMLTGDDALGILAAAVNAVVAAGYQVRRVAAFRAVWLHVPGVRWAGGKLVAI